MRLLFVYLLAATWAWADVNVKTCAAEPQTTAMVYRDLVECEIEVKGDTDLFEFTGQVGDKINIILMRYTGSADECLRVIQPDGTIGPYQCAGFFREASIVNYYTITKPGVHTIQVADGSHDETLRYGLALIPNFPAFPWMIPLTAYGQTMSGNSTPRGDLDLYTLYGTKDDTLSIHVTRTGGSADHCYALIQPDGALGPTGCAGFFREAAIGVDYKLTQTGVHILQIWDSALDETFPYNFEIQCFGPVCKLQPGPPPVTSEPLRFVSVTPCRVADSRLPLGTFGGPVLPGGATRDFQVPLSGCNIPATAQAYALNVTVVPRGALGFLTIWPTGQTQPVVSTLNSDGRIKANAAIVPAGTNGAVSVYVTDTADVVLDINGYFLPASGANNLAFYPLTPCRIADTRGSAGNLGGPRLAAGQARSFPVRSSACGVPATAQAYSLNMTAVPAGSLGFLTTWPTGQAQPFVSTLNSPTGVVVANAAIVPAGVNGDVSAFVTDDSHLVIDINGYFAPPATGALSFYALTPCRISDSRLPNGLFGGPQLGAGQTRDYAMPFSACSVPAAARAYSLNATVVPSGSLGFLTLWPAGVTIPVVSTLNAPDGSITANAALVPAATNGSISAYVTNSTHLILDINGYFAP